MRRALLVLLCAFGLVVSAGSLGVAAPASSKPAAAVRAYVADFNRGDAVAAASHFAADATFSTPLGGCAPCRGRDAIEQKFAGAIQSKATIAVTKVKVTGPKVAAIGTISSPQFPPGITRALGPLRATIKRGLISALTQDYDTRDPQTKALLDAVGASTPPAST